MSQPIYTVIGFKKAIYTPDGGNQSYEYAKLHCTRADSKAVGGRVCEIMKADPDLAQHIESLVGYDVSVFCDRFGKVIQIEPLS